MGKFGGIQSGYLDAFEKEIQANDQSYSTYMAATDLTTEVARPSIFGPLSRVVRHLFPTA